MIKTFAIISVLTTVALAQSSTSSAAAASSTTNPLIPSGISTGCSQFLTTLDSDSTLKACTAPLISATSQYGPGGSATSSPSAASITSALDSLCSTSNGCTESTIQGKLAEFYSACSVELTSSPNADVVQMYDILYTLVPLKTAVCSKDDNGKYCVTESHKPSNSSATPSGLSNAIASVNTGGLTPAEILENLYSPAVLSRRAQSPAIQPNTTTIGGTNLPFLFLQPSLAAANLCTACTRNVLTSYIQFESDVPCALGIGSSPMLNGQSALYSAVQATCGKNFLSGAVQAAGGLSDGSPFSGASRSITGDFQNTLAILGAVTVAFASVL